jgi:hypothetical protein
MPTTCTTFWLLMKANQCCRPDPPPGAAALQRVGPPIEPTSVRIDGTDYAMQVTHGPPGEEPVAPFMPAEHRLVACIRRTWERRPRIVLQRIDRVGAVAEGGSALSDGAELLQPMARDGRWEVFYHAPVMASREKMGQALASKGRRASSANR